MTIDEVEHLRNEVSEMKKDLKELTRYQQALLNTNTRVQGLFSSFEKFCNEVTEIKSALIGYNGKRGICDDLEYIRADYYKFKRWSLIIFSFLCGSGIIGVSIFEFLKLK